MKLPVLFAIAVFPGLCLAADAPAPAPMPVPVAPDSLSSGLWQMLFGLAIVLGLLIASVWLLKRFASPMRGSALLRILGVTALGPREKVVLVEAGEKIFMLGVTPNNVSALHVFARDELPLPSSDLGRTVTASFANRLTQALKGRRDAS